MAWVNLCGEISITFMTTGLEEEEKLKTGNIDYYFRRFAEKRKETNLVVTRREISQKKV